MSETANISVIRRLPWPRSLPSQMALLIAIALFVAQLANFAMLYQGRNQLRLQTVVGPAVTRYIDAIERMNSGQELEPDRPGRIALYADSPVHRLAPHSPGIESAIQAALREAGQGQLRVETEIRPVHPGDPRLIRYGRIRSERFIRFGAEMVVAIELPGRGWLVLSTPWPRSDAPLLWQLLGQTVILYIIVLIPVLLVTRQISLPLRELARAARQFRPGQDSPPLAESGPNDVRSVITAFNALRLRVTAMLDEKDRMLGAIGHDLRTPLAALRVRIESVEDENDRQRMADTIEEMNRTLDDILSLARLGRPSEAVTEVDLAALVDAVVEDFRDIGSEIDFADQERLTLKLRPSLMRRAVRNLIENAIKYAGSAQVKLERHADCAAIIVTDNGPGIPEDKLAVVFDAFTRVETSRNRDTGGIGLGLALAQAIVREAGGDISLRNRPQGGLAATITLPLNRG